MLRAAPSPLGLSSVVCLIYAEHLRYAKVSPRQTPWYVKAEPTFTDALTAMRRLFWEQTLFQQPCLHGGVQERPILLRRMLL